MTLKRQTRRFEYTGVRHDQLPDGSVHCSQDHDVKQFRDIPLDPDANDEDDVTDKELMTSFWSLFGGVVWTLVTRSDVAVYVAPSATNGDTQTQTSQTTQRSHQAVETQA